MVTPTMALSIPWGGEGVAIRGITLLNFFFRQRKCRCRLAVGSQPPPGGMLNTRAHPVRNSLVVMVGEGHPNGLGRAECQTDGELAGFP